MQIASRTSRVLARTAAPVVAGVLVALTVVYSASDWLEQLQQWTKPKPATASPHLIARSGPVGSPITITPMRPLGTDSSVSSLPLPLVLGRTQPGRNSREGLAQIGVNARSPQTYAAGALLANGARLTEVYAQYVVLERNGHSARLYRHGEARSEASAAEQGLLTVGGSAALPLSLPKSEDKLTTYIRPSPVFNGGRVRGYALYPARDPFPFSHLGLQAGDVLTSVNGVAVTGPDGLASLRTLSDGAVLSVIVERNRAQQPLSLDGGELAQAIVTHRAQVQASQAQDASLQQFFEVKPTVTGESAL